MCLNITTNYSLTIWIYENYKENHLYMNRDTFILFPISLSCTFPHAHSTLPFCLLLSLSLFFSFYLLCLWLVSVLSVCVCAFTTLELETYLNTHTSTPLSLSLSPKQTTQKVTNNSCHFTPTHSPLTHLLQKQ